MQVNKKHKDGISEFDKGYKCGYDYGYVRGCADDLGFTNDGGSGVDWRDKCSAFFSGYKCGFNDGHNEGYVDAVAGCFL